ncbi:hypothetical protein [Photobacterium atrarenae]|uniref:Uncharacterized protein n=1 Tax=Photobacterium atrarenae TaxID=865757 RepID=A0ABY5GPU6_9GAMM|nr:hypothetical protein [Photobacterium atrarenae]UTV30684.1 hypothetical protein NNL38_19170 [Photobacterium atrarenae]
MRSSEYQFNVTDVVVVKPNILDPDFGTEIYGWVGTIEVIEVDERSEVLYKIRWSQNTLDKISGDLRQACMEFGLDYQSMHLLESDIERFASGMAESFFN